MSELANKKVVVGGGAYAIENAMQAIKGVAKSITVLARSKRILVPTYPLYNSLRHTQVI